MCTVANCREKIDIKFEFSSNQFIKFEFESKFSISNFKRISMRNHYQRPDTQNYHSDMVNLAPYARWCHRFEYQGSEDDNLTIKVPYNWDEINKKLNNIFMF